MKEISPLYLQEPHGAVRLLRHSDLALTSLGHHQLVFPLTRPASDDELPRTMQKVVFSEPGCRHQFANNVELRIFGSVIIEKIKRRTANRYVVRQSNELGLILRFQECLQP